MRNKHPVDKEFEERAAALGFPLEEDFLGRDVWEQLDSVNEHDVDCNCSMCREWDSDNDLGPF